MHHPSHEGLVVRLLGQISGGRLSTSMGNPVGYGSEVTPSVLLRALVEC
jgi:hypothetical protein